MPQQTKQLAISQTATTAILPAVAGVSYRIIAYTLMAAAPVTVQFNSAATAMSGVMSLILGTALSPSPLPRSDQCLMETVAGDALNLTQVGVVQVSGHLTYVRESLT